MYAMAEPIIGELKGSTAGNSLSTAYNRAHAILKVPSQGVNEYLKLGLWDKSKVQLTSLGGIKRLKGDPLIDAEGYDTNFIKWYFEHVAPVYDKMKLTANQRIRENALLFGSTGGNAFSLVDRQRDLIGASFAAFGKAHHIDQGYEDAANTPSGKSVAIAAEWSKLLTHIGEDVLPIWNVALKATLSILEGANWLFDWTHKPHPLSGTSPVPPPADKGGIVIDHQTFLDGRTIAKSVTRYQVEGLAAAPNAGSGFQGRMALLPVN
jgi:hypothetical protein